MRFLLGFYVATAALFLFTEGCVTHIAPYKHKARAYQMASYAAADAARTPGSLWSEGSYNLFQNPRAHRQGDIFTIIVSEQDSATRGTKTALNRAGDAQASTFATALASAAANNPNMLAAMGMSAEFAGTGSTQRSGQLQAVLPVHIVKVLPNNDFFVEGTKALLLNNEESFLYISGVVRAIDIQPDNTVSSSVLADVEIEYTGRGVVTENDRPGWLGRLLTYVWPF